MTPALQFTPTLNLGANLHLPIESCTDKLAWLGTTGSGKTFGAMKYCELLLEAGVQVVALDPAGPWHGLRIAGTGPAFEIYVFGGLHGDFPLDHTSGAVMADIIVGKRISAVLDVSQWIPSEQQKFATDFADRFFHLQKASPSAVHVFVEECQEFCPQNPMDKSEAKMLAVFQRMWKIGRNFGIGGSLITQRPQDVNKKAVNLSHLLLCFNITGSQELKSIEEWAKGKGITEDIRTVLSRLHLGTARVWGTKYFEHPITAKILPKRTADTSATPKVGAPVESRPLTHVDIEQLKLAMAATIERAKADDPKELHRIIRDLEGQVRRQKPAGISPEDETRIRREAANSVHEEYRSRFAPIVQLSGTLQNAVSEIQGLSLFLEVITAPVPQSRPVVDSPRLSVQRTHGVQAGSGEPMKRGMRRMLIALAQCPGGLTHSQLGLRASISHKSGTFDVYLGTLRRHSWIDGARSQLVITEAGRAAIGSFEPLPTGEALLQYWDSQLKSGQVRMFRALVKHYPRTMTAEELGERADISSQSGTFDVYLGVIRRLDLIDGPRSALKAHDDLMEAAGYK